MYTVSNINANRGGTAECEGDRRWAVVAWQGGDDDVQI